jgi:hypothetical protein
MRVGEACAYVGVFGAEIHWLIIRFRKPLYVSHVVALGIPG